MTDLLQGGAPAHCMRALVYPSTLYGGDYWPTIFSFQTYHPFPFPTTTRQKKPLLTQTTPRPAESRGLNSTKRGSNQTGMIAKYAKNSREDNLNFDNFRLKLSWLYDISSSWLLMAGLHLIGSLAIIKTLFR